MEIDDSIALEENAKRKNQFDSMVEESKQEERVSKHAHSNTSAILGLIFLYLIDEQETKPGRGRWSLRSWCKSSQVNWLHQFLTCVVLFEWIGRNLQLGTGRLVNWQS